jgi:hypothetical protein
VTLISRYVRYVTTMMLLAVFIVSPSPGLVNVFKTTIKACPEPVKDKIERVQEPVFPAT